MALLSNLNRFHGAYSGLIVLISALISTLITSIISIFSNPNFNIENNCISELGIAPLGTGYIFCLGMVFAGIFQIPLYIALYNKFKEESFYPYLAKTAEIIAIISSLCLIVLGIFPFYKENFFLSSIHGTASSINFIGNSVSFFIIGIIELRFIKNFKFLAIISFITSILLFTFWISGIIVQYKLLKIPSLHYTIQWVGFIGILFWIFFHSINLLKD